MFEHFIQKEIDSIKNVASMTGKRLYLSNLISCDKVLTAYKTYFSAEREWWIYSERLRMCANPYFDLKTEECEEVLNGIESLYREKAVVSKEDYDNLLSAAVKMRLNFLIRPRTTLRRFLFKNNLLAPVSEIEKLLAFFGDYEYLINGIKNESLNNISKNIISAFEFEAGLKKIDNNFIFDLSTDEFADLLDPMFAFFSEADKEPEILLAALMIFFDDKGLKTISAKIQTDFLSKGIKSFSKKETVEFLDSLYPDTNSDDIDSSLADKKTKSASFDFKFDKSAFNINLSEHQDESEIENIDENDDDYKVLNSDDLIIDSGSEIDKALEIETNNIEIEEENIDFESILSEMTEIAEEEIIDEPVLSEITEELDDETVLSEMIKKAESAAESEPEIDEESLNSAEPVAPDFTDLTFREIENPFDAFKYLENDEYEIQEESESINSEDIEIDDAVSENVETQYEKSELTYESNEAADFEELEPQTQSVANALEIEKDETDEIMPDDVFERIEYSNKKETRIIDRISSILGLPSESGSEKTAKANLPIDSIPKFPDTDNIEEALDIFLKSINSIKETIIDETDSSQSTEMIEKKNENLIETDKKTEQLIQNNTDKEDEDSFAESYFEIDTSENAFNEFSKFEELQAEKELEEKANEEIYEVHDAIFEAIKNTEDTDNNNDNDDDIFIQELRHHIK